MPAPKKAPKKDAPKAEAAEFRTGLDRKREAEARLAELRLAVVERKLLRSGDVAAGLAAVLAEFNDGVGQLIATAEVSRDLPDKQFIAKMEQAAALIMDRAREAAERSPVLGPYDGDDQEGTDGP